MSRFRNAQLACTIGALDQAPPDAVAEVALAGRSNAGKSSALNTLVERRSLARVARAPGKTRTIQFYGVAEGRFLVDLPGYGYAKVSESMRVQWHRLLERYLGSRTALAGLVLLMDIRHPLTPLDRQLLAWFAPRRLPLHVLLTKCDKVSRNEAARVLRQVRAALAEVVPGATAQVFSSHDRTGAEEARNRIAVLLELEPAAVPHADATPKIKTPGIRGAVTGGKVP